MSIARIARVLLTAACLLLAAPAVASAATYIVETTVDAVDVDPGNGVCVANVPTLGKCTLRAAIEESNATPGVEDTILFGSPFVGEGSSVIFVGAGLPELTSKVKIISGSCLPSGRGIGPCAGVQADPGGTAFTVNADGSSISGLAIGGGSTGIYVEAEGFAVTGNWIGFNLEGGPSGIGTGIFIAPGTNGATIGGTEEAQGNVIGNNGNGLDIEGASETTVRGNYFGVGPDGSTPAANFRDIEVTDSTAGGGFAAADTEIGATVGAGAIETADCDGGCNVIAGASVGVGIDLEGDGSGQDEAPATGPTTVHGNFLGLDAAGTGVVANAPKLVDAGAADDVLVGGPAPGDANFIAGGSYGVRAENGDDLEVVGNVIGIDPSGGPVTPPSTAGIFVNADTLSSAAAGALVEGNTVRMGNGVAIEHSFIGATIVGNVIEGGSSGILTKGSSNGSVIEDNTVVASEDAGIILENPHNEVFGNEVVESGEAGIEISPPGEANISGNVIGGDSAADENVISGSNDSAIEIFGIEASRNEVRRNRGSENGSAFVRLRAAGASEPGNGVEPPEIATAGKTEASGTADPNARVRIFRKASAEEGEIAGFVGEAVADGSGQWKATYAGIPEGTVVTATQTLDGGTSELSGTAKTPPDPPAPPAGCPAVPSACPPPPPPVPPAGPTKPKVTIKKAPKAKSTNTTAKFVFSANESGSKFKCKLDKKPFANCKSPKTYKQLKPGKHVFKVKATDPAGNVSTVVTRKFTVLD